MPFNFYHVLRTKGLMDRASSRLGGLAVWWRPSPSGMWQYNYIDYNGEHSFYLMQYKDRKGIKRGIWNGDTRGSLKFKIH